MRLEGEIHEIELISQLVELGRDRFTGALRFERDAIIKIVYFKEGDILSASTNDRGDSLDEILLKAGKVNREHIKQALEKRKDSETLGDALYSLGFISRKELSWARRVQLVGVLRSITSWTDGSFQIVPDYLPKREEGTFFQIPQIVIELIVTETDRQSIERALPSDSIIARSDDFEARYSALNLNEEADEIVSHVSSTRSVADVASESKSDTFSVFKLLHALITLGLILKKDDVTHEVYGAARTEEADLDLPESSTLDSDEPYLDSAVGAVSGLTDLSASFDAPATFDDSRDFDAAPSKPLARETFDFDPALLDDSSHRSPASDSDIEAPLISAATTSSYRSSPARRGAVRKNRKPLFLSIALVALIAAGLGAWYWMQQQNERTSAPAAANRSAASNPPVRNVPPPVVVDPAVVSDTAVGSSTASPVTTETSAAAQSQQQPTTVATAVAVLPVPVPVAPSLPTTIPPPSTSGYTARAAEHARNADRTKFALQVEVVCQDASVRRAETEGGAKTWYVPASVGNRSCYRVLFGSYSTREEAIRAAGEIPRSLRDGAPVAVAIAKVVK